MKSEDQHVIRRSAPVLLGDAIHYSSPGLPEILSSARLSDATILRFRVTR
jgi:hypothetical protein